MTTTIEPPTVAETPVAETIDVRAATTREAVLKALLDEVKAAYEEARTEVQHALDAQQQGTGGTAFTATLPDGTKIGKIALSDPKPEAKILDREAFVTWAREVCPSSERITRIVKDVQPAWITKILGEMTAAQAAEVEIVDETTVEIVKHSPPGVEIKASRAKTHSLRYAKGGRDLVAEAWRRGELAELALPALAPPQAPAPEALRPVLSVVTDTGEVA